MRMNAMYSRSAGPAGLQAMPKVSGCSRQTRSAPPLLLFFTAQQPAPDYQRGEPPRWSYWAPGHKGRSRLD